MPSNADARLERIYRRLGTREPVCVTCGENNPYCLEAHHIAGQAHHDDTAVLCRNCHRIATDPQKDREHVHAPENDAIRLGHYLCGLADLLALIAASLRSFGQKALGLDTTGSNGGAS